MGQRSFLGEEFQGGKIPPLSERKRFCEISFRHAAMNSLLLNLEWEQIRIVIRVRGFKSLSLYLISSDGKDSTSGIIPLPTNLLSNYLVD